ncbi:hypothetical protein JYT83_01485 [bacterium AH-315-F18]|nr:hypothetical protein [bacterium AH-315-F18]
MMSMPQSEETTEKVQPKTTEWVGPWIEALETAQGILHDAARTPRSYVERLHVEKGGE